jgi:hypothetical protein
MKLIGTKPGETPDQRIARCANNLLKAVVAAGYNLHSTPGVSGFDLDVYSHTGEMHLNNICGGWRIRCGKPAIKVSFMPEENELTEDLADE